MANAAALLAILSRHVGADHGVKGRQLAHDLGVPKRKVRHWVSELREAGHGICGTPETGYFIAANDEELHEHYIDFLMGRVLHTLRLIARAKKVALPELVGQLRLKT